MKFKHIQFHTDPDAPQTEDKPGEESQPPTEKPPGEQEEGSGK